MKKPIDELTDEAVKGIIDMGDTRWNRLLQLAESQRRERVADELVRFLDAMTAATNYTSTVLNRLGLIDKHGKAT